MVDEANMLRAVPAKLANSGKEGLDNQGALREAILQFETVFTCDQAADTLGTDNISFPGGVGDVYVIEGMVAKVGTAFAWTTLELQVGLVAAGGTPSTGAIATHSFVTGGAAGDESFGTYQSAKTYANPKLKVKGGTLYEMGIVQRPTGGIVAGTIKQLKIRYRRARSYDAD